MYSVIIKDAAGKISDVKIDAGTGSVLTVEASDGAEEKGEGTQKEQENLSLNPGIKFVLEADFR